jgi:RimJ/RimL family protein N-acetyltransferase
MELVQIEEEELLQIAHSIADIDGKSSKSTFIYDPAQHRRCHYFKVMAELKLMGFVILKDCIAHLYLYWLSLYEKFRRGSVAFDVTVKAFDYAFITLEAKQVHSEVFESNDHSCKIHDKLMRYVETKRTLVREPVRLYAFLLEDYGLLVTAPMFLYKRNIRANKERRRKEFEAGNN